MLSFDESIGEVGRADHHRIDHGRLYPAFREHRPDGRGDSAADVGRGWLLGRSNDPAAVDQNGIGVRPAHIDTNSHLMLPPSDLRRRADYTGGRGARSEEHTSELQSLMRNSYAVFCLKTKNTKQTKKHNTQKI